MLSLKPLMYRALQLIKLEWVQIWKRHNINLTDPIVSQSSSDSTSIFILDN